MMMQEIIVLSQVLICKQYENIELKFAALFMHNQDYQHPTLVPQLN